MLIVVLGLGLTAVLLVKAAYRHGSHAGELGSMSQTWVAAHNASRPSGSA